TIRERVRIKGEIRTLTAQQRMSGYVVGFLPIGLMIIISVIAPNFMVPMFQQPPALFGQPAGLFILGLGGLLMGIGFILIRRIVASEVWCRVAVDRCRSRRRRCPGHHLCAHWVPPDGPGPGAPVAARIDAGAHARGDRAAAATLRTNAAAHGTPPVG